MMNATRLTIALACLVGLAAGFYTFLHDEKVTPATLGKEVPVRPAAPALPPEVASGPFQPSGSSEARAQKSPDNIFKAENLYLQAEKYRNAKGPGDFAKSLAIQMQCAFVNRTAGMVVKSPQTLPPDQVSRVIDAAQELGRRCSQLAGVPDWVEPLGDDTFGKNLLMSLKGLNNPGTRQNALREIANQGALWFVADQIAGRQNVEFDGAPFGGIGEARFRNALMLAQLMDESTAGASDSRLLMLCMSLRACDPDPKKAIEAAFNNGEPMDAQTIAVAQRLKGAFDANDASRFSPR